jgi:hypothetical protein
MKITLNNVYTVKFKIIDGDFILRFKDENGDFFAEEKFEEVERVYDKFMKAYDKLNDIQVGDYYVEVDFFELPIAIGCFQTTFAELEDVVNQGNEWISAKRNF